MSDEFNIREFMPENTDETEIERCKFWIDANRRVRESKKPNHAETRIKVNETWNLEWIEQQIIGTRHEEDLKYLKYGWPLNASDTHKNSKIPRNQQGAREHVNELEKYIKRN